MPEKLPAANGTPRRHTTPRSASVVLAPCRITLSRRSSTDRPECRAVCAIRPGYVRDTARPMPHATEQSSPPVIRSRSEMRGPCCMDSSFSHGDSPPTRATSSSGCGSRPCRPNPRPQTKQEPAWRNGLPPCANNASPHSSALVPESSRKAPNMARCQARAAGLKSGSAAAVTRDQRLPRPGLREMPIRSSAGFCRYFIGAPAQSACRPRVVNHGEKPGTGMEGVHPVTRKREGKWCGRLYRSSTNGGRPASVQLSGDRE